MSNEIEKLKAQFELTDEEAATIDAEIKAAQKVVEDEMGEGFFEYVDVTFRFLKTGRMVIINHSGRYESEFIIDNA